MNQEDIERNIAFIVDQQAKFFADIEELKALGKRTDARLSRAIRLAIAEARQERDKRRELAEKVDVLVNAQIKTEESLAAFQSKTAESIAAMQAQAGAFQAQVGEALTRMADAITKTNQRIAVLENGVVK